MGIFNKLMGNAGYEKPEKLAEQYNKLLLPNEEVEMGFSLLRDVFIFTTKRLLLIDKQGVTGKKSEYLSLPYRSISRFSIETAGTLDLDAELKLWISSSDTPSVSKRFSKGVDVYEVQRFLAEKVL